MVLDLLAELERSRLVEALKVSFYVYPLLNALHILAIGATVTAVILMDLRILGLIRSIERDRFLPLMREVASWMLPVAMATGIAMFSIRALEYGSNPAFLAKMALFVLAGINVVAYRLVAAGGRIDVEPGWLEKSLALVSLVLWIGILVAGRFIGFI